MILNYKIIVPVVASSIGILAIYIIRRVAPRLKFVDNPDRRRKLHEAPVALGGGIAIWLAVWGAWGFYNLLDKSPNLSGFSVSLRGQSTILAVTSLLVLVLGVADDRSSMRGCHKLVGQIVAATIMVASGFRMDALSGFDLVVELGIFSYPITLFWIVLIINAFNLIDGMDGFCGGISLVTSIALAFMGFSSGRTDDALIALAMAGGLAAFLKYNLPPARIYLGDAGSMTLGMMFSVLSVRACTAGPGGPVSLLPLLSLLTLPLLDVATALGRRWLTGQSLFMPDRSHIHHRLRVRLGTALAASAAASGLALLGACGVLATRYWDLGDGIALLAIATPIVLLVGTDTFGASELRLVLFRLRRISDWFLSNSSGRPGTTRHECRLHGGRDWAKVWDLLIATLEEGDVRRIELSIDMPAAGETYHGFWSQPQASEGLPVWSVVHSIQVGGIHAGEMRVAGNIDSSRSRYLDRVENLVRILAEHLEKDASPRHHASSNVPTHSIGQVVMNSPDI